MAYIWRCPKCKRIFRKEGQQHSCVIYPIQNHIKGKEYSKKIYDYIKTSIKENIGPFTVESLPCCIHFVNKKAYTFAAVYLLKKSLRLYIASVSIPDNEPVKKYTKISSSRYMYSLDIKNKKEINSDLIAQLNKAYKSE